jgi:hypothetical protein
MTSPIHEAEQERNARELLAAYEAAVEAGRGAEAREVLLEMVLDHVAEEEAQAEYLRLLDLMEKELARKRAKKMH